MKKEIHPEYYKDAKVTCSCGNVFTIGSTVKEMNVEVCSACHPFYTGTEKVMDSAGRVEKFKARAKAAEKGSKENKKTKKTETKQTEETKNEKNNEEA